MNAADLVPAPEDTELFSRDRDRHIPRGSGCYVLTTSTGHILYIGLASSLSARFNQHLDNPDKTSPTLEGRASHFHWRQADEINALERGWLNSHRVVHARLPLLNRYDSPVSD